MNILHFSSMAGVGELLSMEANKGNHRSFVIQKTDLDPFGFGRYYGNTVYINALDKYVELLFESSKESDVVIVHDWIEFLDEIECDNIYVYFHGSKLRTMPEHQIEIVRSKVKGIFLSTPDLLAKCPYGIVIPQPVDLELFYDYGQDRSFNQMTINRSYQREFIEPKIKEKFPNCVYYARSTSPNHLIPYEQMPDTLNRWKEYVDWKFDYSKPEPKTVDAYSITALQALACGCDVYNYKGNLLPKTLLTKHDSKKVSKEFLSRIDS